jgi:hypothetical protein
MSQRFSLVPKFLKVKANGLLLIIKNELAFTSQKIANTKSRCTNRKYSY